MHSKEKEIQIRRIIESDLPDDDEITALEYEYMGYLYQIGLGGVSDKSLAMKCYKKAIQLGRFVAAVEVADLYYEEGNLEEYYRWLLEAVLEGDYGAAYLRLGKLYFTGEYVGLDLEKAYKYFNRAEERGTLGAKYYIAYYAEHGILGATDMKKAVVYYIGGAKEYDPDCMKRLDELGVEY